MKKRIFLALVLGLCLPFLSCQMMAENDAKSHVVLLDTARYDYQVEFSRKFHYLFLDKVQWPQGVADTHKVVQCEATISPEGKFADVRITGSGGEAFDAEVQRVLKEFPPVLPAWKDGEPTASACKLTLVFDKAEWEKHEADEKAYQKKLDSEVIYVDPVENPQFPGGPEALKKFMYSSFDSNMPKGSVIYTYTIGTDGKMRNIECVRSSEGYTKAQLQQVHEVMDRMSKEIRWTPGLEYGAYQEIKYTLPFLFK